jgi:two-component system alkaline phosphatase synthesis response regulator PhoP
VTVLRNHCVLVVDDDPAIRLLLVTFLRRRGLRVMEARNGQEALARMRAGDAGLVLMDLMMPEISGWDVLRERAADPLLQRIPVIVVTAKNEGDVAADVRDKGVYSVIGKPFDLDALASAVIACLDDGGVPGLAAA